MSTGKARADDGQFATKGNKAMVSYRLYVTERANLDSIYADTFGSHRARIIGALRFVTKEEMKEMAVILSEKGYGTRERLRVEGIGTIDCVNAEYLMRELMNHFKVK